MTAINLDCVQFWVPPSNPFLHKQRTASSHGTSKSLCTTSSRNRSAPLHNQATQIFKRNSQSTSAIAMVRRQADDSAAGAPGRNDYPNSDDETEDEFPSIEELLSQIPRKEISTGGGQNLEDTFQHLEEPTLDTSGSRLSPTQSRLGDGINCSQGTQDRPVILEDDELDTLTHNPEATTEPSKPTHPSSHELWCDIEDGGYVDDGFCPIPPFEQEDLASTPTPAQGQPYSLHHSPRPLQDQISQYSNEETMQRTSEEPGPHSLSTPLDQNNRAGSEEKTIWELERDLLLAFEEQEKPSLAPASISPYPHRPSKPLHPQIDRKYNQSGTGYGRLQEFERGNLLRSQDQGEESQEQQQRQEVVREAIREEDDDDNAEQEPQGEKRERQDSNDEISHDNHHPKGGDCSHNTSGGDDEDPQPAKRRKLLPTLTNNALTPPDESTLVDNDHYPPRTSRSPSVRVESAPVAEYREWPFQGYLKRITIGNQTTYNLEFALPRIPGQLNLSLSSEVLGAGSVESPTKATASHRAVRSRKPGKELTKEQESLLAKMVHKDKTWAEIERHFPDHTLQLLKENFFTKQGGRPRKRGRKPGMKTSGA